jgi:alkylation response protein AidB-like acyl-CoA dehydrogenase
MSSFTSRAFNLEAVSGVPLRVLTRLAGSDLTAKWGLRQPGERLVYEAVRAGTRAIGAGNAIARTVLGGKAKRLAPWTSPGLFDLTLGDDQVLLKDSARRFAQEVLRPAARAADDAAGPPPRVLEQAHGLGLAGLAIPEELGGVATQRSSVTNAIVTEELARGDVGLAVAVLSPLGVVQLLVDWGSAAQQGYYLPRFLADAFAPAAVAILEPGPGFDPAHLKTRAVRDERGGGWTLWGTKALVPLGSNAELLLVGADVSGLGPRLFVVERGASGVTASPEPAMGVRGAGLASVRFEGTRLPAEALLGSEEGHQARDAFASAVDRARVAWCAVAVGAAQAVLDHVVPYCNERHAFGEPIAHRQGVAFLVANIAIELEGMRLLTWRAASRIDHGSGDVSRAAAVAKLHCAAKGSVIGSDGVQLLGGHGYTKEHPVERWYRDLRAVGVFEGGLVA